MTLIEISKMRLAVGQLRARARRSRAGGVAPQASTRRRSGVANAEEARMTERSVDYGKPVKPETSRVAEVVQVVHTLDLRRWRGRHLA